MNFQNSIYTPTSNSIILSNKEAIDFIVNYWSSTTNTIPPIKVRYDYQTYPGMRRVI